MKRGCGGDGLKGYPYSGQVFRGVDDLGLDPLPEEIPTTVHPVCQSFVKLHKNKKYMSYVLSKTFQIL